MPGRESRPPADISITGSGTTATITVTNNASDPLDLSHSLAIDLGSGVGANSVRTSAGSAVIQNGRVLWTGLALASGQQATATISLGAAPGVQGPAKASAMTTDFLVPLCGHRCAQAQPSAGPAITRLLLDGLDPADQKLLAEEDTNHDGPTRAEALANEIAAIAPALAAQPPAAPGPAAQPAPPAPAAARVVAATGVAPGTPAPARVAAPAPAVSGLPSAGTGGLLELDQTPSASTAVAYLLLSLGFLIMGARLVYRRQAQM